MLTLNRFPQAQRGVVLMITLIVLVAMTLAGIALMRSVETANIIAGNLAFQQAATRAGDTGVEEAIKWLEDANNTQPRSLYTTSADVKGYVAQWDQYAAKQNTQSWRDYWDNTLESYSQTVEDAAGNPAVDSAGNTVAYIIQRLCDAEGPPNATDTGAKCAVVNTSDAATTGNTEDAGGVPLSYVGAVYYQITVRVDGPRNTVSFVQAVIAL